MGYRNGNMIVVTGATGHVGNVLIRELLTQGCVVRALVLPDDDCRPLNNLNVEIVHGDITNPSELLAAFSGVDFDLSGEDMVRGLRDSSLREPIRPVSQRVRIVERKGL